MALGSDDDLQTVINSMYKLNTFFFIFLSQASHKCQYQYKILTGKSAKAKLIARASVSEQLIMKVWGGPGTYALEPSKELK